ncbi:hypothetical protein [Blackfly microvirus SF02]|uniref:Uncharacterized protein n=1 Tax=Blackfly microvirus SF02 TaxID=2576452 RepID=A0A4P8PSD0_9VIRU|nr:hypothetical protein [Blackfly microvirus SF02]
MQVACNAQIRGNLSSHRLQKQEPTTRSVAAAHMPLSMSYVLSDTINIMWFTLNVDICPQPHRSITCDARKCLIRLHRNSSAVPPPRFTAKTTPCPCAEASASNGL